MADDVDEWLAHFGVKGMKWGKRKADGGDGVVKRLAKGYATAATKLEIKKHEAARDGKGLTKIDKVIFGKERHTQAHAKKVEELQNSLKEIEEGKNIIRTLLFGAQSSKSKK